MRTANAMALVNKFNPMVFTEIHGRVEAMLIEPCTPPHEPNYEYDLIAKQFIQLGEAVGMGAIANNPDHNSFEMPYRDFLRTDDSSPSGVAWTEPWDDMTTAYGSQYPCADRYRRHHLGAARLQRHFLRADRALRPDDPGHVHPGK